MLDEVVWCVSDPPEQAKLDTHSTAALTETLPSRYHMNQLRISTSASEPALQVVLSQHG